jgi:hypothetical protein
MPVDAFALTRGATQPVTSKQEAEKTWEPKFIGEIIAGRDPRKPPAPPAQAGLTVATFLDSYYDRYVVAESLRSVASIRSRLAALKDAESRRIPFEPKGRLAQLLKRRRFLGPNGYAFGTPTGQ